MCFLLRFLARPNPRQCAVSVRDGSDLPRFGSEGRDVMRSFTVPRHSGDLARIGVGKRRGEPHSGPRGNLPSFPGRLVTATARRGAARQKNRHHKGAETWSCKSCGIGTAFVGLLYQVGTHALV